MTKTNDATDGTVVHVDPDNTWVRSSLVYSMLALTASLCVFGTMFYMRVDSMGKEIESDRISREKDRDMFVASMREIRDELRRVAFDTVAARQFDTWVVMFRTLNAEKLPSLTIPDLPR